MKTKKAMAVLLSAALAAGMTACGGVYEKTETTAAAGGGAAADSSAAAGSTSDSSGKKIFRYSEMTEPTSLDPSKCDSILDNEIQHAIQEPLVRNTGGELTPGLAETWDISDDGLVYTFHLRDARWSDGEPVKADDFVYSLQRLMDPATGSKYAFIGEYVKNGAKVETGEMQPTDLGVKAVDDKTLEITLENPTAYFLSMIGSMAEYNPIRRDIVEKYGTDYAAKAENNVYTGPFTLKSSDNQQYVFEKNPNYWNADAVDLDGAELSIVTQGDTALAMYEAGDLDFVKLPNEQVPNYDDKDNEYMNGNEDFLYINEQSDNPLLGNKDFRQALNYGLDRNSYIKLATNGVYSACNTLVMPLVSGVEKTYGEEYDMASKSWPLDGDKDKAKEYLQKAMDAEGISNPADIKVTLTTTDHEDSKKYAEVIQQLWTEALGITVEVKQVTYANIYGEVLPNGDYEVAYAGWGPDYSDPYTYLELFKSDNPYNYSKYKNDEVDKLLAASKTESDAQKRMDELNQAEQLLLDDAALVPLQCRQQHYLLNDKFSNITFYFSGINTDWAFAKKAD